MDGYARFGLKYTGDIDAVAPVAGEIDADAATASTDLGFTTALSAGETTAADITNVLGEIEGFEADRDAAQADVDAEIAATGVATEASLAALEAAQDDLDDADALLAAISGQAAVAAQAADTMITSRFRVNSNASATADNGMVLGAKVRMQADASGADKSAGEAGLNGAQFYLQTGGLKVSVGNICGSLECMPGQYANSVGLTGLGYENVVTNFGHDYYSSTGAGVNGVQVDYTMGEFALAVSHGEASGNTGVVLAYNGEQFGVAVGMQDGDTDKEDITMATAYVNLGDGQLNAAVSDNNGDTKWRVGGSYNVSAATSLTGYVTQDDRQYYDDTGYGIGVSHSLGGGVSLRAGFVHSTADYNVADFGMFFSF